MKNLFGLLLLGAAGYLVWRVVQSKRHPAGSLTVVLKDGLPAGAQMTGRIESTNNTQPPESTADVVGFALKDWAEVILPTGEHKWVEVSVK